MAFSRKDKRQARREGVRHQELGYYLILTDTEKTEKNYFEGLKRALPLSKQQRITIRVESCASKDLVAKAKEAARYSDNAVSVWLVFDRDRLTIFDQIVASCQASGGAIHAAWTNPCLEIWFYAYFDNLPSCFDSVACVQQFKALFEKKTGQKYQKNDEDIYRKLCQYGSEPDAIRRMQQRDEQFARDQPQLAPSQKAPCGTIYRLVQEIRQAIAGS